jgi:hypothetical protein
MRPKKRAPAGGNGDPSNELTVDRSAAATSPGQISAPDRQTAPVATAVGRKPSGARAFWAWIVANCPYGCGGSHLHRGGPQGGLRRAGCGLGQYQVTAGRRRSR